MVASQRDRGSHTVISPHVANAVLLCYQRRQTQALLAFGLRRPLSRGPLDPKHARQHRCDACNCVRPTCGTKGRGRAMKRKTLHMRQDMFFHSTNRNMRRNVFVPSRSCRMERRRISSLDLADPCSCCASLAEEAPPATKTRYGRGAVHKAVRHRRSKIQD